MERRFAFDELTVDPLQKRVGAECKRVVQGFLEREISISAGRVDVGDRVARRAGDARPRHRIVAEIVAGIVESSALECPGKERCRIVAARAPARGVNVAVSLHAHPARLPDREQIRWIAERAEAMSAVIPFLVDILMALLTIGIHHQGFRRNEIARGGTRQRRKVVLLS